MNKVKLILSLIFVLLLQVFICNNIQFLGYLNPYIYVAFVFIFPLQKNRFISLFAAFIFGLLVDFFSDTGGIHSFSLVSVTFVRIFFLRIYFRKSDFDFLLFRLHNESLGPIFNYVITLTFLHHVIMFLLANFSFENWGQVLIHSLYTTIFTTLIYFLGSFLFRKQLTTT